VESSGAESKQGFTSQGHGSGGRASEYWARRARRHRHLVFLAHMWACAPFVIAWHLFPPLRQETRPEVLGPLQLLCYVAAFFMVVRTVLAWFDPPWLAWEYVFPVLDLMVITVALHLRRDPNSVLMLAYFLPIAEAASTLSVAWAGAIGLLSVLAGGLVTYGQPAPGPIEAGFRLFFLYIMAGIMVWMARLAAELRAGLTVAADRNRIALEMHDGVQGQLMTIAAQLELARCVAPQDGPRAARLAADARDLARNAADELRFLVHRLRAPELGSGFLPALKQYVHHLGERHPLSVSVQLSGEAVALDPEVEHALFRVVQESLTNTLKHAAARSARLQIDTTGDVVRCTVCDDGAGFTLSGIEEERNDHCGLASMRERMGHVGGALCIETAPGEGTCVVATVPLPKSDRGRR
jgi:signal transduction histidine kinase